MSKRDPVHSVANAPVGDLAQLVAMEQDLEQRLTRAREEARSQLTTASAEAEALARAFEDTLSATGAERRRQLNADRQEGEDRILAEGRRRAQWYDQLTEATENRLAEYVVARLLGSPAP